VHAPAAPAADNDVNHAGRYFQPQNPPDDSRPPPLANDPTASELAILDGLDPRSDEQPPEPHRLAHRQNLCGRRRHAFLLDAVVFHGVPIVLFGEDGTYPRLTTSIVCMNLDVADLVIGWPLLATAGFDGSACEKDDRNGGPHTPAVSRHVALFAAAGGDRRGGGQRKLAGDL